jgi:hypothetical protein
MIYQRRRPSIIKRYGKEKRPAGDEIAAIPDHLAA